MSTILLTIYFTILLFDYCLRWLNLRHQKRCGGAVPPGFEGRVDPERLREASAYTRAVARLGIAESVVGNILLILFLFGGILSWYDRLALAVTDSFIAGGLLFFFGIMLLQGVVDIPFSLYRTFVLERRFGFNTTTLRLWCADLLKSALLSAGLLAMLLSGALLLVQLSPRWWWLWVWMLSVAFALTLMILAPRLIEPLFNKMEPVRDSALRKAIADLMARAGLRVERVLQVDASRRSRHSNAYFTGIGKVQRIVLFDTLLEQLERPEILAVLAHEAGHWKKKHVFRRLLQFELLCLAVFFLAHRLLPWGGLPGLLGLEAASFYARSVILLFLFSLAGYLLAPLFHALSRRQEREADRFAVRLTQDPQALASALVKLSRENLANLHPHPLYARFHYSHPPVVERVNRLRVSSPAGCNEPDI